MDIGTILTVGIVAFLIVSTFVGFVRGSAKSFFRFITVALSAVLAFVGVIVLKNLLGEEFFVTKINAVLAQLGMQQILNLASASPLLEEIILKTIGGAVAPIMFFVAFFAISAVTYVI